MDSRSSAHSAPYGQACMQCFKAKCKCTARADGGQGCERCHRLNKQCLAADGFRKRNAHKPQNSNNDRITQLESKLDSVVSLLHSIAASPESSDAIRTALEKEGVPANGNLLQQSTGAHLPELPSPPTSSITTNEHVRATPTPTSLAPSLDVDKPADGYKSPSDLSAAESEAYLNIFRTQMLPSFPLLHIPPSVTAHQLRQDRPFLFRAIVTVVPSSTHEKLARGTELKAILAQSTVLENKSTIDLLLGLLTYVAWSYDQLISKSDTLSRLMLLSMSLVYDLRLDKPVPQHAHKVGPALASFKGFREVPSLENDPVLLLEQQRAALGCFLLSSIVSFYFATIDPLRWTPQMENFLRAVGANKVCPTDEGFAFRVRLQLIAQRAAQARQQQEADHAESESSATGASAPPLPAFIYLKTLQGQMRQLKQALSPSLQQQGMLMTNIHFVELCINESAYTVNSDAPLPLTPVVGSNNVPIFEHLDCLWRSVSAIKSWFDAFLALSPLMCAGYSFDVWAQLLRCMSTLYRLTTYADPAWDRKAVRNTVDLLLVLDLLADKVELANNDAGELPNSDIVKQMPIYIRNFRAWASEKIASDSELADKEPGWAGPASGEGGNIASHDEQMLQSIDWGDEMWIEDIFGRF